MKQYVTISYEGVKLNSVEVLSFIEKLKSIRLGIEDVHINAQWMKRKLIPLLFVTLKTRMLQNYLLQSLRASM